MVEQTVRWFKKHREVLEGDLIHLRRADARDLDYWLMVNPQGREKGMLMVFNPIDKPITRTLRIPLYYTGLSGMVQVSINDGEPQQRAMHERRSIDLKITVGAGETGWATFR